jgi:hypothetical protein
MCKSGEFAMSCPYAAAYEAVVVIENGATAREETRTGRLLGRLAHAQIGDLRQGSDQVRKPQLGDGVFPTFCASSYPRGSTSIADKG